MVIAVVAGMAAVVAAVVLLGRRRSTDTSSVRGYRQTLSTLEHLQERPPHDRAPLTRPPESAMGRLDAPRVPPRPLPPPSGRRAQRSLVAMNHQPRRLGAPILVLAVLAAVIGAIVYVGLRSHHNAPAASRTTDTTGTTHHHDSSTTTTTTALPARYTAVSATTTSATYAPATSTYTLSVGSGAGSCWMSVTESNGTTVMAQTLTSGSTRSFSLSGKATILIGAPSVASLKIDDVPAVLPTGAQAPFTVTVVPAG